MYYTTYPVAHTLQKEQRKRSNIKRVKLEGRWLTVLVEPNGEAVILSAFSSNPRDYLDPRFKPGRKISLPV